jgi:phosphate transport system permease protein
MTVLTTAPASAPASTAALTSGRLPKWVPWGLLAASFLISAAIFGVAAIGTDLADFNIAGTAIVGIVVYMIIITVISSIVESRRKAVDRLMTALVATAFLIALLPLISLLWTVVANGITRFDAEFFSSSMRNVVGDGGGIVHAIWGTVLITLTATIISVPVGLMTSIYLVEYGRGRIAKAITFFVDVMTGIPSIVAGLFIYAGALALAVLMTPVVVRGSEELLKIVPNELREASYALGVPKWLTILKVVLPTSIAGITTSIMLAISRVIGETAPLLLTAGFTQSLNTNLFGGQMMTLPVFAYNQYMNQGTNPDASIARAWAAALTLILIVMVLNLLARLIAKWFAPKISGR